MTGAVRIAIIGAAGWAGRRHLRAFHALGAHVAAVVDPHPSAQDLAREVGAEVKQLDDIRWGHVDLAVVALPSSAQPEIVAGLLARGLRVLVEKPIGSSPGNAAILDGAANANDALMVGYTLHHHPVAKRLADWMSASHVISVSVRSAARKLTLDSWRTSPKEGGVGVVNGIHAIEYVASQFPGTATVQSSYQTDGLHCAGVPDYAVATLSFEDGPLFRLESYWNPWNHTSGLNESDWFLEMDVVAHEGRRVWSNWALHEWNRDGSETVHHFPEVDLFLEQARAALRFARGEEPVVGYRQALRATVLADNVFRDERVAL